MSARGTLWGVGLGPGDPELVTVKAARVIGEADVVAYHSAPHGHSIARGIAEPYLRPGQLEEHLVYPVTTEATNHPGGYAGALEDFYADATERIATHLDAGRNVALLAEGDPLFYSSYMHLHTRLTRRFNAVIVPGVRRHPSDNTDEPARARLACSLADQGRAVAVVSSGDPGVFAMATAVLEEAEQWPGVRVRVIPAMTAAQAVASRVGAPLGHDYAVISLSDRLKPWDVIAARLTAAAAADLVLAIYNPASVTRTWQVGAMRELLLAHRDPGIPVVIGRNVSGPVSGPNEDVRVVKLADLNPAEIDMRCLLIVGSSQTRWYSVDSQDRVFTPRRYPEAGRATATKSSRHSD